MANENKTSFPVLSVNHWWKIREQFKKSIPGVVSGNYIGTVLNMKAESAVTNVIPSLKMIKLIDQDGKTLEIAKQWRDDADYPKVCETMRKTVYPKELFDVAPNPTAETDKEAARRWFANNTGAGEAAVTRMLTFYILLCEANPNATKSKQVKVKPKPQPKKSKPKKEAAIDRPSAQGEKDQLSDNKPSIHLNIQIHISADATADQIDQIFASMSKHIYHEKL